MGVTRLLMLSRDLSTQPEDNKVYADRHRISIRAIFNKKGTLEINFKDEKTWKMSLFFS